MRTRLTDPLEIAKAFIEGKDIYFGVKSKDIHTGFTTIEDIKSKVYEFWIEQTTWVDDLKPILDAKWVTVEGDTKWKRVDEADLIARLKCVLVDGKWYSYEEAIAKIKPVEE